LVVLVWVVEVTAGVTVAAAGTAAAAFAGTVGAGCTAGTVAFAEEPLVVAAAFAAVAGAPVVDACGDVADAAGTAGALTADVCAGVETAGGCVFVPVAFCWAAESGVLTAVAGAGTVAAEPDVFPCASKVSTGTAADTAAWDSTVEADGVSPVTLAAPANIGKRQSNIPLMKNP